MKRRALAVLALAALGAAALAATAGAGSSSTTSTQAVNCRGPVKLAIVTPLTGGGGFIGQEQLTWTKYGIKVLSKKYGLRVQLVQADTPVEKGPGEALVVSANDPLNLAGTVLPGAKVPRLSGARVLYRDGIAQAALVAGGFQALATLSAGDEQAFRRALLREPDPFDVAALVAAR